MSLVYRFLLRTQKAQKFILSIVHVVYTKVIIIKAHPFYRNAIKFKKAALLLSLTYISFPGKS